jgi:hypothetical protein
LVRFHTWEATSENFLRLGRASIAIDSRVLALRRSDEVEDIWQNSQLYAIICTMNKTEFEWDENKNQTNQRKHGVSFEEAQYAFHDDERVIAEELSHSQNEQGKR